MALEAAFLRERTEGGLPWAQGHYEHLMVSASGQSIRHYCINRIVIG